MNALICVSSTGSGTEPIVEHRVVEFAEVEFRSEFLFRFRAQFDDLDFAELVAQRLTRPRNVAIDFGFDFVLRQALCVRRGNAMA